MFVSVAASVLGAWLLVAQEAAPAPAETPAALLQRCDDLLERRLVAAARTCYEQLASEHAASAEARDARRALATMRVLSAPGARPADPTPAPVVPLPPPAPGGPPRMVLVEPFSAETGERMRISTWEKLDFGITAFLYGMSAGLSLAAAGDMNEFKSVVAPVVLGSLLYTGLAVGYVNLANPDRGDLPLTLAISSYLPLSVSLGALAADVQNAKTVAAMATGAAVVSIPIAYLAAAKTDLDPGDTQLVRDAGFWSLVISFSAATALEREVTPTTGAVALAGLYGGMGLGLLAAHYSEVSLERTRVTTWGGYGGGLIGLLLGVSRSNGDEEDTFGGLAIGSALGLVITFLSTASIDRVPDNAQMTSMRYLEPALLPLVARDGRTELRPGVTVLRGRF